MNLHDLPAICTLAQIQPYLNKARGTCWNLLQQGKFPIRYIESPPYRYRFLKADVIAYVERGEKTNLLLRSARRPHFGSARMKAAS